MFKKLLPERGLIAVLLLYILAELLAWPLGNFPLNDDWAYGKCVQTLVSTGKYDIGTWPAMSLWTHIMYGSLFTKLFGFSFNVLRVSTILSSFVGTVILFRLLKRLSGSANIAFAGTALYVFHPVYFVSSNSYMTEITFSTLFIAGISLAVSFFETGKLRLILAFFLVSTLLTLVRQYGIVLPVVFVVAVVLTRQKWHVIAAALASLCATYLIFHAYEKYLRQVLPSGAAYKFSGNINPLEKSFYRLLAGTLRTHLASIVLHLLVFLAPLAAIRLPTLIRSVRPIYAAVLFIVAIGLSVGLFRNERFPDGNVFVNSSVGAMTFYEDLTGEVPNGNHTWTRGFHWSATLIRSAFPALSLFVLMLAVADRYRQRRFPTLAPTAVFVWLVLGGYVMSLLVTESYFDRYHIPLYAAGITVLALNLSRRLYQEQVYLAAGVLLLYMVVSVGGTHDYFTLNRIRWEAYRYLTTEQKIAPEKINAGFEPKGWNEGRDYVTLYDFNVIAGNDYLVQYRTEPGFKQIKSYPFRRYFPPRADTIFVFRREQ